MTSTRTTPQAGTAPPGRGLAAAAGPPADGRPEAGPFQDEESARWVRALRSDGARHAEACDRLHAVLLRIARRELARRRDRHDLNGPELDDVAHQVAADALLAVTRKVGTFRGESRFTTWAYSFVVFEVSSALGRHWWRTPRTALESEEWERLPDRLGLDPVQAAEAADLLAAVRKSVENDLTPHQRRVFTALVIDGVPLDALVAELGSNRNALYKTVFDARRRLRTRLAGEGFIASDARKESRTMSGFPGLDAFRAFLDTDPRDVGCERAMAVLHIYAEIPAHERARKWPGVEAHLRACGPCDQDFQGLLAALSRPAPEPPPA